MLFWKGTFYTRLDILKWLANTLGGVHLDLKRTDAEVHIAEIKDSFGFEIKDTGNNYQMLVGKEIEQGRADRLRRPFIYNVTELIAIDTARIFVSGIRNAEEHFLTCLA